MKPVPLYQDDWILAHRPPRNRVSPDRPYAWLVEQEPTADGRLVDVATLFLTNRECPFRCLMCDLWKNTLETPVAPGEIPTQIQWALAQLATAAPNIAPAFGREVVPTAKDPGQRPGLYSAQQSIAFAQHLKLYNSGNFFDPLAIPPQDYEEIARLAAPFERVIVECHPRLIGSRCWEFSRLLSGDLEVALGLETVHPQVLPRLNKQMTLDDFARAVQALRSSAWQCGPSFWCGHRSSPMRKVWSGPNDHWITPLLLE